ncbi:bah and coiled-coil domain-containing protein 1 [Phtheirospermum japonicum]|uniref:Bah and coiled-coil domain-containing protein 1 n=1 Tax=Phtheirospermum japonicum TaxID=374723 RepID=A0A830CLN2_9LAMI|nr:bah and coiled-coil domain-containing protein 1 [Phtheirospermum japonicum]
MRQRRFAQAMTCDDEDNAPPPPRTRSTGAANLNRRERRLVRFEEDEEEEQKEETKVIERKKKKRSKSEEPETESEPASENVEPVDVEPQPMGAVVRVSGKGRGKRTHYQSFEYNGLQYSLEDPALFHPENQNQKPYVAIIKDIAQTWQGELRVTGQWFYRPEEAKKRGGGNWELHDTRELFYSFHRDEVPAESVFHKCVVHFIPLNKQIPPRQQHPGFIVQQVYDTERRVLFKLTDKDYEEDKQHEIDLLVQKTVARLGGLTDLAPECKDADREGQLKNRRLLRRRNMPPLAEPRKKEGLSKSQSLKIETPGNGLSNSSEYYGVLSNFKLLTGETQRDRWLEKLLQSVQYMCTPVHAKSAEEGVSFHWPDAAIPAIVSLEKAAHDALSFDFQKYNQKMRQLEFNLKRNAALARRLLNRELEPARILNMSPNELKEGLTAEEIESRQPEESGHLQMTDAHCKRCNEKQVGLIDIIQTGLGDRYQLECVACGNTWYASRDDAATLTIEGPSSAKTVGTAPLVTAKFENVEKGLLSPGRAEKGPSADVSKKTTDAFVSASDNKQGPFNKTQTDEKPADTT